MPDKFDDLRQKYDAADAVSRLKLAGLIQALNHLDELEAAHEADNGRGRELLVFAVLATLLWMCWSVVKLAVVVL